MLGVLADPNHLEHPEKVQRIDSLIAFDGSRDRRIVLTEAGSGRLAQPAASPIAGKGRAKG